MSEKVQLDMALMIATIKDNMPALIEKIKLDAKLHKVKYDSLIGQGFTESQALELCKNTF